MTQLPPKFHTSVNCGRSNQLIEATTPSEVLEPWSHPWHALQRTLATAFGGDAGTAFRQTPGRSSPGSGLRAEEEASWLVRARAAAAPPTVSPALR
jgi:hypothetical protein